MGMFAKILLTIWLICGTAGSIYFLGRRFVEMGIRVVNLHNETCLEDPVLWPTWLMALILISCIFGLMGIVCKLKLFQWFFTFLVNVGVIYVIAIMVWRILMFGWVRKPTPVSFDEVYNNNSPLDVEYKTMFLDAMVGDHAWSEVDKCLKEIKFCEEAKGDDKFFADADWIIEDYYEYYREGCCEPPSRCAKNLITFKGLDENDDCKKWANSTIKNPLHVKCYDCNSCKAARLATYQTDQEKVRVYSLIAAIFLFVANFFVGVGGFE